MLLVHALWACADAIDSGTVTPGESGTVTPGDSGPGDTGPEIWNGADDDRDGEVDEGLDLGVATRFTGVNGIQALGAGDVDGDAVPELLVAGLPLVAVGGDPTELATTGVVLQPHTWGLPATQGDFTGDGLDDVVGVSLGPIAAVTLLRGPAATDGTPLVSLASPFSSWGGEMATGDFDADGIADLIATGLGTPYGARVWSGLDLVAAGDLDDVTVGLDEGGYFDQLAWGDVDGDGYDDLVASDAYAALGDGMLWVVSGPALPGGETVASLASVVITGEGGTGDGSRGLGVDLAVGDVDGDGRADLAAGGGDAATKAVPALYTLSGAVDWADLGVELTDVFGQLRIGDVDGDGLGDVVSTNGAVSVWWGGDLTGASRPASAVLAATDDCSLVDWLSGTADVDGDGRAEIYASDAEADAVVVISRE